MKRRQTQSLWAFIAILSLAAAISVSIRRWVIEPFQIPNSAMRPTLLAGDTIFVFKWPFQSISQILGRTPNLHRGDVIVFSKDSSVRDQHRQTHWIRRIIGIPGDQVALKKGRVILNRKPLAAGQLASSWVDRSIDRKANENCSTELLPQSQRPFEVCLNLKAPGEFQEQTVPDGFYLVVSDWRSNPDSDHPLLWSLIPKEAIEGKPWLIWLSIDYSRRTEFLPNIRWKRLFQKIE